MSYGALTIDDFRRRLDEPFRIVCGNTSLDLVLAEVEDVSNGSEWRAFSLIFAGPLAPVAPQAIYRLDNAATGPLDIFLVPLGPRDGACRYQAVFS